MIEVHVSIRKSLLPGIETYVSVLIVDKALELKSTGGPVLLKVSFLRCTSCCRVEGQMFLI